jgi:hypothetical protein
LLNYHDPTEDEYSSINYLGNKYNFTIFMMNGDEIECMYVKIKSDTLYAYTSGNAEYKKINLSQIHKVVLKDNFEALLSGVWMGLGSGTIVGIMGYAASSNSLNHPNIGPLLLGLAVVPVGGVVGYFLSGKKEYIFNRE